MGWTIDEATGQTVWVEDPRPTAPPSSPDLRQTTTMGGMKFDWLPGEGRWVSAGPTSALGRAFDAPLAASGRGQDVAAALGREPTALEVLRGVGGMSAEDILSGLRESGRFGGRDFYRGGGAGAGAAMQDVIASRPPAATDDDLAAALAGLFVQDAGGTAGGYAPSFIDLSSAEAMLPLTETPEERAAIESLIADLEARGEAGVTAVRSGWEGVRAINQAAADKARQMAVDAGPEAAQLWIDAANNALMFARQTGDYFSNLAGMQSVDISPTGGAANISALLAAQAPRARAFAERMGMASAEDIASQARTASMMGEAYAGDITRTVIMEAQRARAAHNDRVLNRIAQNRQAIAGMRASAAATNAQIANQAAQFAASQVASMANTPERRRALIRELATDINNLGTSASGASLIEFQWGIPRDVAQQLIDAQQQGLLDWTRAQGVLEAELQTGG